MVCGCLADWRRAMRITLMNASPKGKDSASQQLIDRFIPFLKDDEYGVLEVNPQMDEKLAELAVNASDAVVIFAPIYLDSLPCSALALMDVLEAKVRKKGLRVAAVLQCGFYEPENTEGAMEVLRQWCQQNEYVFTGGIGIGAGGALAGLKKVKTGRGLLKQLPKAYASLYEGLKTGKGNDSYFSLSLSKRLYTFFAELGWKMAVHQQGLENADLAYQPKGPNSEKFSKEN